MIKEKIQIYNGKPFSWLKELYDESLYIVMYEDIDNKPIIISAFKTVKELMEWKKKNDLE